MPPYNLNPIDPDIDEDRDVSHTKRRRKHRDESKKPKADEKVPNDKKRRRDQNKRDKKRRHRQSRNKHKADVSEEDQNIRSSNEVHLPGQAQGDEHDSRMSPEQVVDIRRDVSVNQDENADDPDAEFIGTGYQEDYAQWNDLPPLSDVQSEGDHNVDIPNNETHEEPKEGDSTATGALLSLLQGMAGSDSAIDLQSGDAANPLHGVCTMLERVLVGGCLLNATSPEAVIRKWFELSGRTQWSLVILDAPEQSALPSPSPDYTSVVISARINVRIRYIKAQLTERANNAGLHFNAHLFPWISMRWMIYQAGYQMVGLPDQVPFPGLEVSRSAHRGITGLPTELTVEWTRYLPSDKQDKGIRFRRLSESEAKDATIGRIPIIVCAAPHPKSPHATAKRLFMTEARMWQDRGGPPRSARNEFGGEYLPTSVGDVHCEKLLMAGEGTKKGIPHKQGTSKRLKDLVSQVTQAPKSNIEPRRSTRIDHRGEPDEEPEYDDDDDDDDDDNASPEESSAPESTESSEFSESTESSESSTLPSRISKASSKGRGQPTKVRREVLSPIHQPEISVSSHKPRAALSSGETKSRHHTDENDQPSAKRHHAGPSTSRVSSKPHHHHRNKHVSEDALPSAKSLKHRRG